jgi:hypothetical protein
MKLAKFMRMLEGDFIENEGETHYNCLTQFILQRVFHVFLQFLIGIHQ